MSQENKVPKEPSEQVMKLYKMGYLTKVEHQWRQTGTDTSEYWIVVSNKKGESTKIISSRINALLDYHPCHNSVCQLLHHHWVDCGNWLQYEKANQAEVAEYQRLKAKYEGEV